MKKQYLVRFKPLEPYFFGNEKTFPFKGEKNQGQKTNSYYIASEETPMQTTILGALRFIHLPEKSYEYAEAHPELIGPSGFKKSGDNEFGDIKAISPVFLMKSGEKYVFAPYDDTSAYAQSPETDGKAFYTPLGGYMRYSDTSYGKKIYSTDYNGKLHCTGNLMNVETGGIITKDDVIKHTVRTGNAKLVEEGGFFKKDFCYLAEGWCFATIAMLDGEWPSGSVTAYLGQNKSAFAFTFEAIPDDELTQLENKLATRIGGGKLYVWGESFVSNDIYQKADFAITDTREYREVSTKNGKLTKSNELYSLLRSGSIFVSDDTESLEKHFEDKNCETIGFNKVIRGRTGGKE